MLQIPRAFTPTKLVPPGKRKLPLFFWEVIIAASEASSKAWKNAPWFVQCSVVGLRNLSGGRRRPPFPMNPTRPWPNGIAIQPQA
jgi:hypothetical protein